MGSARKEGRRAFRAIRRRISRFSRSQTSISSACLGQEVEDHVLRFGKAGQDRHRGGIHRGRGSPRGTISGEVRRRRATAGGTPGGRFPPAPPRGRAILPIRGELLDKGCPVRPGVSRGEEIPRGQALPGVRRKCPGDPGEIFHGADPVCGRPGETDGDELSPDRCHRFSGRDLAVALDRGDQRLPLGQRDEEPLLGPVEEVLRRPGGVARRRPLELGRERCDRAPRECAAGAGRKRAPP